mmetsp:Transcript_51931/g.110362  ORF Transcript_51931/g.110362 Transcript_51931/m.110362 type:complete len:89 (+) Transcript_51931:767-1033(+)
MFRTINVENPPSAGSGRTTTSEALERLLSGTCTASAPVTFELDAPMLPTPHLPGGTGPGISDLHDCAFAKAALFLLEEPVGGTVAAEF